MPETLPDIVHEPLSVPATAAALAAPEWRELDAAIAAVLARIDRALPEFTDAFPAPSSVKLVYPAIANDEWTNGFWTGLLWLAWELSGEARYHDAAAALGASFVARVDRRVNVAHHDLGFLYTLSSCAEWRLTGNQAARAAGLDAAMLLLQRFSAVAGVIQAWGDLDDPEQAGRMIIDCNLNLPLLYWASAETGDLSFRRAARRHFAQAARLLVRPDASTFHTYHVDVRTGAPRFGSTHQGRSDDSCWARGQAWGIYGFALGYALEGDAALLGRATALANYFINRLPEDLVCYWDLDFTSGAEPRDTSAAAIAACGLLEIVRHLPVADPDRDAYAKIAWGIVRALGRNHLAPLKGANGVLANAVYHMPNKVGVDESCIWGDYFYLEALMRLGHVWTPYWYPA